jgi:prepilin-type N-terminal cleavage/methylation domain-containing protein
MNLRVKKNTFCTSHHKSSAAGFTLVEFMVAMVMFVIVSGAVLEMFAKQAPYFARQQNLVGVNIAMQNAVSQMQLDLANAGTGYYPGALIASSPVGVTITNQPAGAGACNVPATFTYTLACFDTLNILTLNPNVPAAHPTDNTGGTASTICSQIISSPFYIQPVHIAGQTLAQDLASTAAQYHAQDQVLLIAMGGATHSLTGPTGPNSATASSGTLVNSFILTAAPTIGANFVSLPFTPAAGPGANGVLYTGDSLGISDATSTNLGNAFCAQDWVMKLEPTKYSINVDNPQDPILQRTQNGIIDNIAEQIIGFKVGAATWYQNAASPSYSFFAASAQPQGYGKNYQLVRSVRVTMIGRTNPNPDPTYTFRNTFDGGPYQVLDASVVINPRNMTMNGN